MRTVVAFVMLMVALMGIGLLFASAVLAPSKDLFLPPPDGECAILSRPALHRAIHEAEPRRAAVEV